MTQTYDGVVDGRELQFHEMMERLGALESKYRGVRGELLRKVREELMKLKPARGERSTPIKAEAVLEHRTDLRQAETTTTTRKEFVQRMLPSCRVCGRTMRDAGDGALACDKGHVRLLNPAA